ncbi:hypothetical protein MMC25_002732 [Agyrium rufum]|nr:hypothetical protein [Agyrium rufum]
MSDYPRFARFDMIRSESPEVGGLSAGHTEELRIKLVGTKDYDLRPHRSTDAIGRATWLDQDESGDYDPNAKPSLLQASRKRKPSLSKDSGEDQTDESSDDDHTERRPKACSWQNGRQMGIALNLTFRFKSDSGKALLAHVGENSNNWPNPPSPDPNFADLSLSVIQADRLRNRQLKLTNLTYADFHTFFDPDNPSLKDLTLGHPAARGCIPCLQLAQPCPFLIEGETYPCRACDDEHDCVLVTQPQVRAVCLRCKQKRIKCSYRESEENHDIACRECAKGGHQCLAGPKSGRMRTGPSLNSPVPGPPEEKRRNKHKGKMKRKKQPNIDNRVEETLFLALGPMLAEARKSVEPEIAELDASATPTALIPPPFNSINHLYSHPITNLNIIDLEDGTSHSARPNDVVHKAQISITRPHRTIQTSFAHPMVFGDETTPSSCSWCYNDSFGIIGLGERMVVVEESSSGLGFVEISGGHVNDGTLSTRMCLECTTDRLLVVGCEHHRMTPIDGIEVEMVDALPLSALFSDDGSQLAYDCCAVCVNIATHSCSSSTDQAYGAHYGCELNLCTVCSESLTESYKGDLSSMIRALEVEKKVDPELHIRADAGLLLPEGELMKFTVAMADG